MGDDKHLIPLKTFKERVAMLFKLSLRSGLLIILILMTVLLFTVSTTAFFALNAADRSLTEINRIHENELATLYQSNSDLLHGRSLAALVVRKQEQGDDRVAEKYLQDVKTAVADSQLHMSMFMKAGTVTLKGKEMADDVALTFQAYMDQAIVPMVSDLQKGDLAGYYQSIEKFPALMGAFTQSVKNFNRYASHIAQQQFILAGQRKWTVDMLLILCSVIVLGTIVVSWHILRKALLNPLSQVTEHLTLIADGDLSRTVPLAGNKDLHKVMSTLQHMQNSLTHSVQQVSGASVRIDQGCRELGAGIVNLSQRTEESAASLEQTAASMEQITATVRLNASNAHQAHELSTRVSETAHRGADVVNQVVEKMQDITQSSQKIGDILGMIDDIAFQTNILALNASVEAARAGEQGRGFSVVANEVRSLAQRSANAAKDIRQLIGTSQSQVSEGSRMATRAGNSMSEIYAEVSQVSVLMKEISVASDEQSRGIEQINVAVTQMDEVAQQNAALVEQATSATHALEDQSASLQQTMAAFRLTV